MSFLAGISPNFAANQRAVTNKNLVEPAQEPPGFFEGALDPITSGGALDTLAANAKILGGLALTQFPKALDQLLDSGTEFTDLWMATVVDPAVQQRKAAMPDPRTHGMAAQIVQGLATVLPEAVLGGPIGAGVIEGTAEAANQVSGGKPVDVALKMGAITGLSTGVGVALPAAAPVVNSIPLSALKQRLASGAFGNLLFGAADREARHKVLADAGFEEEAAQYRFDDPTYALVDLVMGAGFGALAHVQAKPSETAAALALNEARKIDNSAPGLPTDATAATEHYNALRDSLAALENGDEVTARVDPAKFLPDPVKESADAELLAMAGNRLTREDRQRLEFERADLEYKLKQFDEQGGYTKQDFIDQARAENPRAPARQVARIAEQMAADARINDRTDRQSMLERVNKQLEDDALARELFGEMDRSIQNSLIESGVVIPPEPKFRKRKETSPISIGNAPEGGYKVELSGRAITPPEAPLAEPEVSGGKKVETSNFNLKALGNPETTPKQKGHTEFAPHAVELNRFVPFLPADSDIPPKFREAARQIPTFQGGKTKMAYAATDKLIKFFGADAEKISTIDDWFGGSGGWGGYLASTVFRNVRKIRVHEFSPSRLEKIKLFHERGNEVTDIFKSKKIAPFIDNLVEAVERDKTLSGSGIVNRIDQAFSRNAASKGDPMVDAIIAAMQDQGTASFGKYGKGKSGKDAVEDLVRRVSENAQNAFDMFNTLRSRGVEIEYIAGDSYRSPRLKGNDVLSVVDPPYYATKGYNGESVVGLDTYNKTRQLLENLVNDDNSVIYTDEAWFDKADPKTGRTVEPKDMLSKVDGLDAVGQLMSIRNSMDAFFRTPIDRRIETLGLYNGTNKPNRGRIDIGSSSEKGPDKAERSGVGEASQLPVQRPDGGMAGRRIEDPKPPSPTAKSGRGSIGEPPEMASVRQLLETRGDDTFTLRDDDGVETTASLRELLDGVDQDMKDSNQLDSALQAAVNCFLRFGDNA